MANRSRPSRLASALHTVSPTGEGHRVTSFELFFDLVYVFAITQVTHFMAEAHSAYGILQGMLILALLWWTWSGYAWLGNQARADEGILRIGMIVAMAAMFVVALTIPEAWHDAPGGLNGPVVLVWAYVLVRLIHLLVYTIAARDDAGLKRQLAITWIPAVIGMTLLAVGVHWGGWQQTAMFAVALGLDMGGVYLTSLQGGWRIHSPAHFNERNSLFIMLAIGESVVATGTSATGQPTSAPLLLAAVLGIGTALGLWWLYFDVVSPAAEHRFAEAEGRARAYMALTAYTYGHFPIVAGIMLTALGIEEVLMHASSLEPLGNFTAAALFGGLALYLAGHVLVKHQMHGTWSTPRLATLVACLLASSAARSFPPLVSLVGAVDLTPEAVPVILAVRG